ncbi:ankyrin repeat domain-containing protein [Lelliottia sp. WAP21]|uniref:ankyrin repeat domain-containing protein n=1 Tax=Lelliottia sp. WAP21 TaxID=2877426 RepID=UPI001E5F38DE|nr:ankyrin repeat domain-containing protein [Lelliottia sp. WAP21]
MKNILRSVMVIAVLIPHISGAAALHKTSTADLTDAVGNYAVEKTPHNLSTIKEMLDLGTVPDIQTLFIATYYKMPDILDVLLKYNNSVDQPIQENGETLLSYVLRHIEDESTTADEKRMVLSLIKAGANVNDRGKDGNETPLMVAANGGSSQHPHLDMVKVLLDAGADATLTTSNGFNALTGMAASNLAIIDTLVEAGADPYNISAVGSTPLHFVCGRAYDMADKPDPEAVKRIDKLLKPGSSIDAFYSQEKTWPIGTPLRESLESRNPDCVRALIEKGANPDAIAYPESIAKNDPSVKGMTVRQIALRSAKEYPELYSADIIKLLER